MVLTGSWKAKAKTVTTTKAAKDDGIFLEKRGGQTATIASTGQLERHHVELRRVGKKRSQRPKAFSALVSMPVKLPNCWMNEKTDAGGETDHDVYGMNLMTRLMPDKPIAICIKPANAAVTMRPSRPGTTLNTSTVMAAAVRRRTIQNRRRGQRMPLMMAVRCRNRRDAGGHCDG